MVRAAAAGMVLLLLVAGCVVPEQEPDPRIFGACPHWAARGEPVEAHISLSQEGPASEAEWVPVGEDGTPELFARGRPFDMVQIEVEGAVANASVSLTAFAGDGGHRLRMFDYASPSGPRSVAVARLAEGNVTERVFETFLSPVDEASDPAPGPVVLRWALEGQGTADLLVRVTLHDKVCGVVQRHTQEAAALAAIAIIGSLLAVALWRRR